MRKLLLCCGILSALFTGFHLAFWRLFDWPASLGYMTAEHRMLMQTFNLCILPLFACSTYAYLALRNELLTTKLGRAFMAMNAGLYLLRALAEPLFGDLRRGESLFFLLFSLAVGILFAIPLFRPASPPPAG